jgi:hypothetical protein
MRNVMICIGLGLTAYLGIAVGVIRILFAAGVEMNGRAQANKEFSGDVGWGLIWPVSLIIMIIYSACVGIKALVTAPTRAERKAAKKKAARKAAKQAIKTAKEFDLPITPDTTEYR